MNNLKMKILSSRSSTETSFCSTFLSLSRCMTLNIGLSIQDDTLVTNQRKRMVDVEHPSSTMMPFCPYGLEFTKVTRTKRSILS